MYSKENPPPRILKKKEDNKRRKETQRQFLLSFFNQIDEHHEEKQINGFWLSKNYNNNQHFWYVSIYTQDSFQKYKDYISENKNTTLF